jgi:hypothetical protein
MRREGKAFTYTPQEVAEIVRSCQESLMFPCEEPNVPLTTEQERQLGILINFLQVIDTEIEQAGMQDSDGYNFRIRYLWNTAKDGCTVRIVEEMADMLAFVNLDLIEEAVRTAESGRAFSTLMHCDIQYL